MKFSEYLTANGFGYHDFDLEQRCELAEGFKNNVDIGCYIQHSRKLNHHCIRKLNQWMYKKLDVTPIVKDVEKLTQLNILCTLYTQGKTYDLMKNSLAKIEKIEQSLHKIQYQ